MTPRAMIAGASLLIAALAAPAAAAPKPASPPFDRAAWQSDYARFKQALANGYANLDWQVDRRNFNLVGADKAITGMLDAADSDVAATLVFVKLVDAFKDPHLELRYGPAPGYATLLPRQSSSQPVAAADLCKAAKYSPIKPATRLPYAKAPGWTQLSEGPFLAGTIGATGFLRIPAFGEDRYADACARVAKAGLEGRPLQLAVRAELNRQLAALIGQLKARGMTRLAIDVSGNGGGTEWAEEVAAMLSARPLTRQKPRRAGPACDRSAMWRGERPCPIYAAPAEQETIPGTGVWNGPLVVLTDARAASATEEFITLLKDSKRAAIVGARTFGSGCGYVDGGSAFQFRAANMHVMMPNCSRYTGEGINEIEGIAPTHAVDWAVLAPAAVMATLDPAFAASR